MKLTGPHLNALKAPLALVALALCILLGTAASPVMDYLDHAATSLHEPRDYIRNVLEPVAHGTSAPP